MSNRMDTIYVRNENKKKMQLKERGTQVHGKEGSHQVPQSQQTLITLYYSTA